MRMVWTICRGSPHASRRRIGGDWGAYKGRGRYIGELLVTRLSSSVRRVVGRYIVVRMSLNQSFGGGTTTIQSPFLALVLWQSSEKEEDENKRKHSDSG